MYIINEDGEEKGTYFEPHKNMKWFRFSETIINYIASPTIMVNKTLLGDAIYNEYIPTEDWYLWLKLMYEGDSNGNFVKFGHVYERLVFYRVHQKQVTNKIGFPIQY